MANTAGFYAYQDFASSGLRLADFLYRERLLEIMQDSGLHAFCLGEGQQRGRYTKWSGLDAAQEELHGTIDAFRKFVGTGEIHRPLPNHGLIESLHEFGEMKNREDARDFAAPLALGENLTEQADRDPLGSAHLRRAYGVHRT
jgi:hypothetical protein